MSAWEGVWGLWWLWRAPRGWVGHSQPVEGQCCALSAVFERQLWELFMGEMGRTGLKGSLWCGVPHPKALCGLFQAPLVRPEGDLFSDTNINRTKPKKNIRGRDWG